MVRSYSQGQLRLIKPVSVLFFQPGSIGGGIQKLGGHGFEIKSL